MKNTTKPTAKTLKVMDLNRLHPKLQQSEFQLKRRKVNDEQIDRPTKMCGQDKLVHYLINKSIYFLFKLEILNVIFLFVQTNFISNFKFFFV